MDSLTLWPWSLPQCEYQTRRSKYGRGGVLRTGRAWSWPRCVRVASSPPLPNSGNLVPEPEPGKLFTGGGRRRRCDGVSVGRVPGEDWSATGCEVYAGHLSRFERCCGAAGNSPEILRTAFPTDQKKKKQRLESLGWELENKCQEVVDDPGSHLTSFHHQASTRSITSKKKINRPDTNEI